MLKFLYVKTLYFITLKETEDIGCLNPLFTIKVCINLPKNVCIHIVQTYKMFGILIIQYLICTT